MDPLTIATAAGSLAVTAGKVTLSFHEFIEATRRVDKTILELHREAATLQQVLVSVERTLKDCGSRSLTLWQFDDELWKAIQAPLTDCQAVLDELVEFAKSLKAGASKKNTLGILRKTSLQLQFMFKASNIEALKDRISASNCAIQTALAAVNVSLGMRGNLKQDELFEELQKLRSHLTKLTALANNSPVKNLQSLARAGKAFYAKAGSTASTDYGWVFQDLELPLPPPPPPHPVRAPDSQRLQDVPLSHSSTASEPLDLTEEQRRRIQKWRDNQPDPIPEEVNEAFNDDDDDDDIVDFFKSFKELATQSLAKSDFDQADMFLRKAIEKSSSSSTSRAQQRRPPVSRETQVSLDLQLAATCCMLDRWDEAAQILSPHTPPADYSRVDAIVLLCGVSAAFVGQDRLLEALRLCKAAVQGHRRVAAAAQKGGEPDGDDYWEALLLLATIYEMMGHKAEAEAIRHTLPASRPSVRAVEPKFIPARYIQQIVQETSSTPAHQPAAETDANIHATNDDESRAAPPVHQPAAEKDADVHATNDEEWRASFIPRSMQAYAKALSRMRYTMFDAGDWPTALAAAPLVISNLAILLKAADTEAALRFAMYSQYILDAKGEKILVRLPSKYFHLCLHHCGDMGKLAFFDAQEGMSVIRQIAWRMIQPNGNIIRLLNDPEQARCNLRPQIEALRKSTQKCFERAQQTRKKFFDWYHTIMNLKATIFSRKDDVLCDLESNPELRDHMSILDFSIQELGNLKEGVWRFIDFFGWIVLEEIRTKIEDGLQGFIRLIEDQIIEGESPKEVKAFEMSAISLRKWFSCALKIQLGFSAVVDYSSACIDAFEDSILPAINEMENLSTLSEPERAVEDTKFRAKCERWAQESEAVMRKAADCLEANARMSVDALNPECWDTED